MKFRQYFLFFIRAFAAVFINCISLTFLKISAASFCDFAVKCGCLISLIASAFLNIQRSALPNSKSYLYQNILCCLYYFCAPYSISAFFCFCKNMLPALFRPIAVTHLKMRFGSIVFDVFRHTFTLSRKHAISPLKTIYKNSIKC